MERGRDKLHSTTRKFCTIVKLLGAQSEHISWIMRANRAQAWNCDGVPPAGQTTVKRPGFLGRGAVAPRNSTAGSRQAGLAWFRLFPGGAHITGRYNWPGFLPGTPLEMTRGRGRREGKARIRLSFLLRPGFLFEGPSFPAWLPPHPPFSSWGLSCCLRNKSSSPPLLSDLACSGGSH